MLYTYAMKHMVVIVEASCQWGSLGMTAPLRDQGILDMVGSRQ